MTERKWIDIHDELPALGSSIFVRLADSPTGYAGHTVGTIINLIGTPEQGEDWPLVGEDLFIRYWQYLQ